MKAKYLQSFYYLNYVKVDPGQVVSLSDYGLKLLGFAK